MLFALMGSHSFSQTADRYWWDTHGTKAELYSQPDVFAFRTTGNTAVLNPGNMPGVFSFGQEDE